MKRLSLYSLMILSMLIGCSKKSETPTFKRASFTGIVWEENGPLGGCTNIVKFDDTKRYEGLKCGADQNFSNDVTYTYDNKSTITIDPNGSFTIKYVIVSLSDTTLKMDYYLSYVKRRTYNYTKL